MNMRAQVNVTLVLLFGATGLAFLLYETWSQPDLALWVRLLTPFGLIVIGLFADVASPVVSGMGVGLGIALLVAGFLGFVWARTGGGPRWFYEKVKQ
jgi:hypothetical protein